MGLAAARMAPQPARKMEDFIVRLVCYQGGQLGSKGSREHTKALFGKLVATKPPGLRIEIKGSLEEN